MQRWLVVACVLAGCWRGDPPPPAAPISNSTPDPPPRVARAPATTDDPMAKMGEFRDKMCSCSDKACADAVTDEMTKWSQDMAKDADKNRKARKGSGPEMKQMQEVTEDFTKCAIKAMTAGMSNP